MATNGLMPVYIVPQVYCSGSHRTHLLLYAALNNRAFLARSISLSSVTEYEFSKRCVGMQVVSCRSFYGVCGVYLSLVVGAGSEGCWGTMTRSPHEICWVFFSLLDFL